MENIEIWKISENNTFLEIEVSIRQGLCQIHRNLIHFSPVSGFSLKSSRAFFHWIFFCSFSFQNPSGIFRCVLARITETGCALVHLHLHPLLRYEMTLAEHLPLELKNIPISKVTCNLLSHLMLPREK